MFTAEMLLFSTDAVGLAVTCSSDYLVCFTKTFDEKSHT
ncbi:hypothetical protein BC059799_0492 [Bacillus cereus NVH0597-99]|nr:hypothetical protein BC059799_0492 [Bacillus cereus NVH0597-99]